MHRKALILGGLLAGLLVAAGESASALDWTWRTTRSVDATGAGCGGSVVKTVPARKGAFDVAAVTPLGAPIEDPLAGVVVARVTAVAPVADAGNGVPGIAFTLTGSDDVCSYPDSYPSGWSVVGQPLTISYRRHEHVYFSEYAAPGNALARERPKWVHQGSDIGWNGIRWRTWGGRVARGRGYWYYVEKGNGPYRVIKFPQRYKLSDPQPCGTQLRYLRWDMVRTTRKPTRPRVPRHWTIHLSCDMGIWSR